MARRSVLTVALALLVGAAMLGTIGCGGRKADLAAKLPARTTAAPPDAVDSAGETESPAPADADTTTEQPITRRPTTEADPPAEVDWEHGIYMAQALDRIIDGVGASELGQIYGYADGIAILGAYLAREEVTHLTRRFEAGKRYYIVGAGDEDATDIDLHLTTVDGTELASDVLSDATPVIEFNPDAGGDYTIALSLPECAENYSMCAAVVLQDGGWDVPLDRLTQAMAGFLAYGERLNHATGANFAQATGTVLYGLVMEATDLHTITLSDLAPGAYTFLASGDRHAEDLDLVLADADGLLLEQDIEDDAEPRVAWAQEAAGTLQLTVETVAAQGPAVVTVGVLERR